MKKYQNQHAKLIYTAATAAICIAILLVILKGIAWWLSGSVSLLAGLTDSLLDSIASLVNFMAITVALKPADDDHRYGHGKAEALAGLAQAAFITISAIIVAWQGVNKLLHPEPLESTSWSLIVIVFSIVITAVLLAFQHYVIKKTSSTAIAADSLHYRSDLLLNISILIALLCNYWGWQSSDAIFGIGISFYILWSAISIAKESTSILMDEELPSEIMDQVMEITKDIPDIMGVHDLRSRKSGTDWFIQLHLELPEDMILKEAHCRCVELRKTLQNHWPNADIIIHADPR